MINIIPHYLKQEPIENFYVTNPSLINYFEKRLIESETKHVVSMKCNSINKVHSEKSGNTCF